MNLAHAVLPNSEGEVKLAGEIRSSLEALTAKAESRTRRLPRRAEVAGAGLCPS